jgi:pimeloyl-ACP methyl ester carboxylesterase
MKPAKTFFIIPGFGQQAKDKAYNWLTSFLRSSGFNVVHVPIHWERRVMSDYINDFESLYSSNKSAVSYVLGFSYGAVVAFSTAEKLRPNKIFLCSLSPDFKEDHHVMKPWIKKLVGKRRLEDSKSRSAISLAKELTVPTVIFYGEEEGKQYPQLKLRSEQTQQLAKHSKLIVVPKAPHKIDFAEYQKAIIHEIKYLT